MANLTLINLIPNPYMDSGWSLALGKEPTKVGTDATPGGFGGGKPLYLAQSSNSKEITCSTTGTIHLYPSHIYYTRVYAFQETLSKNTSMGFYWPIAEPYFEEKIPMKAINFWQMYSAINDRVEFTEGDYAYRVDFNRELDGGDVGVCWISCPMLIDLTACFGEGKEPTQEWCDKHIPFFKGTKVFDTIWWKMKDITPVMTSNTTPSGYVASASSEVTEPRAAWCAFNSLSSPDEERDVWHGADEDTSWLQLKFPEKHKVKYISIKNAGQTRHKGVEKCTLLGSNDGTNFTKIADLTNPIEEGITTIYKVSSPAYYQYYRLNINSVGYIISTSGATYAIIDELRFYEAKFENYTKVNGVWKPFYEAMIKENGVWKNISGIKIKSNTSWK